VSEIAALPTTSESSTVATRPPSSFKFLLSGLNAEQKASYVATLESLGATVYTADHWTSECTHLIIIKPNRSEKCLAACAAGRWVLKPDYVAACSKAGKLLDEDRFEWGKPASGNGRVNSKDKSCTYWRARGGSAFKGWKVCLIVDMKRKDGFTRLLQAGGAEVEICRQIRSTNLLSFTHVLIDSAKQKPIAPSNLEFIRAQTVGTNTVVMDVNYIADFIYGCGDGSLAKLEKYDVLKTMLEGNNNNVTNTSSTSVATTKRNSKK
jgi:topoisomerase (DNA) II binding protein 1